MPCNEVGTLGTAVPGCAERLVQPSLVQSWWARGLGFLGVGQRTQSQGRLCEAWQQLLACPAVHSTSCSRVLGEGLQHLGSWDRGAGFVRARCLLHSCRGSNTIAASQVSSLPLLLLVFLGAERWERVQLEGWKPGPLSFLLSLLPSTPLPLQHPAGGCLRAGSGRFQRGSCPRLPWRVLSAAA